MQEKGYKKSLSRGWGEPTKEAVPGFPEYLKGIILRKLKKAIR